MSSNGPWVGLSNPWADSWGPQGSSNGPWSGFSDSWRECKASMVPECSTQHRGGTHIWEKVKQCLTLVTWLEREGCLKVSRVLEGFFDGGVCEVVSGLQFVLVLSELEYPEMGFLRWFKWYFNGAWRGCKGVTMVQTKCLTDVQNSGRNCFPLHSSNVETGGPSGSRWKFKGFLISTMVTLESSSDSPGCFWHSYNGFSSPWWDSMGSCVVWVVHQEVRVFKEGVLCPTMQCLTWRTYSQIGKSEKMSGGVS